MFTKKHFEAVAAILREQTAFDNDAAQFNVIYELAVAFADKFAESNPRFDRARFLDACGVRFCQID